MIMQCKSGIKKADTTEYIILKYPLIIIIVKNSSVLLLLLGHHVDGFHVNQHL